MPINFSLEVGMAFMTPENSGLDKSSPYIKWVKLSEE